MIEREFQDAKGTKTIGSSHGYFGFVVQSLDHTARNLLSGLEIVEQQLAVSTQRSGDLLHRRDAGSHRLLAPEIQERAGPGGRVVFPELLKIFFEEIGTDGLEVVAEQISQTELLLRGEILFALEHAPTRLLQQRRVALLGHLARLGGADLIQRLIHLGDDVEAVEDVQRLGTFLTDHVQVRLPHVRANKLDLGSELLSDDGEETLEGFEGAFLANPKQAGEPLVDLVDQGQVFVAFGVLDFIHTNGADRFQCAMFQAPADHILDSVAHLIPGSVERLRRFLPGELARPAGQKQHIGSGQLVLAIAPGDLLDHYATISAVDPSHPVQQENQKTP